jgi:integrase/recombinase XerC
METDHSLEIYEPDPVVQFGISKPVAVQAELLQEFYRGKKPKTLEAYRKGLQAFAEFVNAKSEAAAISKLIGNTHGAANILVLGFRSTLVEQGFSPSTVNQRLSAVRSLIQLANMTGIINWKLDVKALKSEKYKDTRGPGQDGFERLLQEAKKQRKEKAARDVAVLWLLYGRVLRREEVISMDLEHFDGKNKVSVMRKGKLERELLTIPTQTATALHGWIAFRGEAPGPMFFRCDKARQADRGRLTGKGLWQIVSTLGTRCGLDTWPHALRHAGITEALRLTKDPRAVQKYSGHKKLETLLIYDDNLQDQGGDVAQIVADGVKT